MGQRVGDFLRGGRFAELVNRLRTLATTHPQPTRVGISEEQTQGPSHAFILWGVRWIGERKTAPDEVLQGIQ